MKRKIHILGSGNAAKRHREAIERLPALYTVVNCREADIVVCASKPYMNQFYARAAMSSGKDVILEKPFGKDIADLSDLRMLEHLCNQRIYPVLNYRNLRTGSPDGVSWRWRRDPSYYEGWRGRKETAFGGVIMSHGIHFIDMALRMYGEVGVVHCMTSTSEDYHCDVETCAEVVLGFSTGRTLSMNLLISTIVPTSAPTNPGWDHFYENLDSAPRLEELYHLQQVIDACYESAREERWVTIS